ncbi:MAG: hypothetical protein CV087_23830 [Candidatus Brocadia sp. WS118]|nr:MAG: hypothetical protein CV087_23830 [Candidatus Brocadia sp. WS118]
MQTFKLVFATIFAICFFLLVNCGEDLSPSGLSTLSASFVMDKTSAMIGEEIQFTNHSEHATSYKWDFGDGNSSTEVNPTHAYLSAATFTITLTAIGEGGSGSATDSITIEPPLPSASFVMDKTSAIIGEEIQFTNHSKHATSYEWDFGDGNSSTEVNPTHVYLSTATFTITLTANGEGGSSSVTDSITIIEGGANTWYLQDSGINQHLNDVFFINSNVGWTVATDWLKTTNGGRSWFIISPSEWSSSIFFINDQIGWFAGGFENQFGFIVMTLDGGITFTFSSLPVNKYIRSINFQNYPLGYAVGDLGTILKTTDGGNSWIMLYSPTYRDLYDISFFPENNNGRIEGIIVGGGRFDSGDRSNFILKISDSDSVSIVMGDIMFSPPLQSVDCSGDRYGWTVGSSRLYSTTDRGETWNRVIDPAFTDELRDVFFLNNFDGWIVGRSGIVLRTHNGGEDWERVDINSSSDLNAIYFTDQHRGWIVGSGGKIFSTINPN